MIASVAVYAVLIGLWFNEKRFNRIGGIVILVQETLTLAFGLYVLASFDAFVKLGVISDGENAIMSGLAYECLGRFAIFSVMTGITFLKSKKFAE